MTAMQQLINEIVEHLTYDDDLTEDSRIALETIRLRCLGKLEMEKQQIIEAAERWKGTDFAEKYYAETYGSKGSDEHIVDTNEMIQDKEKIKTAKDNSKIGIRWKEYQDWLNEVPELSDEEIEKELFDLLYDFEYEEIPNSALYKFDYDGCAKALTKWYREQLKVINDKTNG